MNYRDMIHKVQEYSGLSEEESEKGLKTFINTLSCRLTPHERTDFVSELPRELQSEAASVDPEASFSMSDVITTMAESQHVDENRAKQLVSASWKALRDALTTGEIDTLKAGLPRDVMSELTS
jgi:uncharacterized protein (DUF2267 family)